MSAPPKKEEAPMLIGGLAPHGAFVGTVTEGVIDTILELIRQSRQEKTT